MTTFVTTLGFDSTRVTRPVLTHGLEEHDEIILVQPTNHENPRADEAKQDIRRIVGELQPNIDIETLSLNPTTFLDNIRRVVEQVEAIDGETVLILGGGAREIYLPVAFTAFVQQSEIDTVLQFSDISGSVSELEIPNFLNPPGESVVDTLEVIVVEEQEGASLALISNVLDVAKSTVARHVTKLEERDFVRSEREGKSKIAYPTEQGRLAIDIGAL